VRHGPCGVEDELDQLQDLLAEVTKVLRDNT